MTRPATSPADAPPAAWYNYVFDTDLTCQNGHPPGWHPLYEGKSNDPQRRLLEHAKDQPWFPYVTGWRVHPQRYATEDQALVAEKARIRRSRPLANREHNWDNPCRLDFGEPEQRSVARRPRPVSSRPRRRPSRRRWPHPARRLAWRAALWSALAVATFVAEPGSVAFGTAVESSVLGATLLMAVPLLRRRRRRRW